MTALAKNKEANRAEGKVIQFPVKASTTIYKGALVNVDADGWAVPATDTTNEHCVGVARGKVENTGANGALKVDVYTEGVIEVIYSGTATEANVGDQVYVLDDQTVDVAGDVTNDLLVGRIVEFIDADQVRVKLDTF